jgi:Ca2+-binding RTX toxin-like protein
VAESQIVVSERVGLGRVALLTLTLLGPLLAVDAAIAAAPKCLGQAATIVGTAGDDQLRGTGGDDVIVGLGGLDQIFGEAGDDIICGGPITPRSDIEGNPLPQVLGGGPGADRIAGGEGFDELYGYEGNDVLFGRAGYDVLYAEEGSGRLFGGPGDDILSGVRSRRVVSHGGPGEDYVEGSPGRGRLFGDRGRDRIAPRAGSDFLSGGAGWDIADESTLDGSNFHSRPVSVNLVLGIARGPKTGIDRLSGDFEEVWTGWGSDHVTGDARDTVFFTGGGARDIIDGGPGSDTLTFSDAITGSTDEGVRIDLASGKGDWQGTRLRIRGIDNVTGAEEGNVLFGDDGPNRLSGDDLGSRDDRLYGRGGNDVLIGGEGQDQLLGGAGNDRLFGNRDDDLLDGGPGRNINDGGPGTDTCVNPRLGPGCE